MVRYVWSCTCLNWSSRSGSSLLLVDKLQAGVCWHELVSSASSCDLVSLEAVLQVESQCVHFVQSRCTYLGVDSQLQAIVWRMQEVEPVTALLPTPGIAPEGQDWFALQCMHGDPRLRHKHVLLQATQCLICQMVVP